MKPVVPDKEAEIFQILRQRPLVPTRQKRESRSAAIAAGWIWEDSPPDARAR